MVLIDKLWFSGEFADVVLSHNREPPARADSPTRWGKCLRKQTKGDGAVSVYEKQSPGRFFYSPALFCGKRVSPIAMGAKGRCPLTPQAFEKSLTKTFND